MTAFLLNGQRRAGVLLHPTSLPGSWEAGVLGADARRFVEWLRDAGFRLWQMLPVGPVGDSLSPYQVSSAFAGNPHLIDPEALRAAGWLQDQDRPYDEPPGGETSRSARTLLLKRAWNGFQAIATCSRGAVPASGR